MSRPYPQDRRREQREKGEQPYKDAKESLTENEAEIRDRAIPEHEIEQELSEEDRKALLEQSAEDRFSDIGDERREEDDDT